MLRSCVSLFSSQVKSYNANADVTIEKPAKKRKHEQEDEPEGHASDEGLQCTRTGEASSSSTTIIITTTTNTMI